MMREDAAWPENHLESDPAAELEKCRAETRSAFENRALMYAYILDEAEKEIGIERAAEMMKRAIHRRGLEVGAKYRDAAQRGELDEVARLFVEGSPSDGSLFKPGVEALEDGRLVLRMSSCPLVDAWRAAGYSAERIDLLCEVAAAVDEGTFEAAGLDLTFLERAGEPRSCRCLLELRSHTPRTNP